jgi:hypothetical protein
VFNSIYNKAKNGDKETEIINNDGWNEEWNKGRDKGWR